MPTELKRDYAEKSFGEIFNIQNIQYEVPFFQRGYVWGKDKWVELIKGVVLEQVCEVENASIKENIHEIEDIEDNALISINYYFGTIYLKSKKKIEPVSPGDYERYLIIDGQQRLMTIYLFLVKLFYDLDNDDAFRQKMTEYRDKLFNSRLDQKSKLYTLKSDEHDLMTIVTKNHKFSPHIGGQIPEFNNWYNKQLANCKSGTKYKLFIVLFNSLKITQITLSENDDEMLIFENLNDKGTPLNGAELLCNYIFQPIIRDAQYNEVNIGKIHSEYWLNTQTEVEKLKIQTGGRKIAEGEQFLFYLRTVLSVGRNKMIGRDKDIYYTFKKNHPNPASSQMEEQLAKIHNQLSHFQNLLQPRNYPVYNGELTEVLSEIDSQKVYTSLTFLLPLLEEVKNNENFLEECTKILQLINVFLFRKNIARLKTQEDNVLFPRLWEEIKDQSDKVEKIKEIFKERNLFVSDTDLENVLLSANLYNQQGHLILKKIDKDLCNFNETPDYSRLDTIEHILPQGFSEEPEWDDYLAEDYNENQTYKELLTSRLHTIGNLMLVGGARNSSLQKAIYPKKFQQYESNSGLSKNLKETYLPSEIKWNLETIEKRSRTLAKIVIKIWNW